jgi:hypothetical protein
MQNEVLEARGPEGQVLRLEFVWRNDRYGQVFSVVDESGRATPLLESADDGDIEGWPQSPPLQSLSFQALPDSRRAALLVGMAGRSHWSASIEPLPGQAAMQFDIACRVNAPRVVMGSRYRAAPRSGRVVLSRAADGSWAEATCTGCSLIITRAGGEAHPAELAREGDCLAVLPQKVLGMATVRWLYRVELLHDTA